MALLEQKPHRVRRKIAFMITVGAGLVLLGLLIIKVTQPLKKPTSNSGTVFTNFFKSLLSDTPSTSGQK